MQIRILVSLLFLQSFVSCQQNQEKAPTLEANVAFQSTGANWLDLEKTFEPATKIVFQSTDGGQTWQDASAGLPKDFSAGRVFANGDEIILSAGNALYHSKTASTTPIWEKEDYYENNFFDVEISGVFQGQTGLYLSSYQNGFYKRIPGTGVLIPLHANLPDKTVRTVLETPDGAIFVGCESGIFKTTDSGQTWKKTFAEVGVNDLVSAEGVIVCSTYKGVLRSTDGGEHWDWVLNASGGANTRRIESGFAAIVYGDRAWNEVQESGMRQKLYTSLDQGKTWQRIEEGLAINPHIYAVDESVPSAQNINDIEQLGKNLFCSTDAGIFRSSNGGKTWELVLHVAGRKMLNLAVSGNVIYAVKVAGC